MRFLGITVNITIQQPPEAKHPRVEKMEAYTGPHSEHLADYSRWIKAHEGCMWLVNCERAYLAGRHDERNKK